MRRVLLVAGAAVLVAAGGSRAEAQERAPFSPFAAMGPRIGRVALSVGGGWPSVYGEVDVGVTDTLAVGVRVGYLYGQPHGELEQEVSDEGEPEGPFLPRVISGAVIEIPARVALLSRERLQLTLDTMAGIVVGDGRELSSLPPELVPTDPTPVGFELAVGITLGWRLRPNLLLNFGFQVPTTLVLSLTEAPYDDVWELGVGFAPRIGVAYAPVAWMSLFCVADIGPAVGHRPVEWTSDHFGYETDVELYMRLAAGLTFNPWP